MIKDKLLIRIKENQNTLPKYLNAMSELTTSGIFDYIRSLGKVKYLKADSIEAIAVQAGWSKGFNDALDILFNFQELYLDKQEEGNAPPLDFGALDIMLANDLITKEEADAIRNGTNDTLLATYLATVNAAKSSHRGQS